MSDWGGYVGEGVPVLPVSGEGVSLGRGVEAAAVKGTKFRGEGREESLGRGESGVEDSVDLGEACDVVAPGVVLYDWRGRGYAP